MTSLLVKRKFIPQAGQG